MKARPSKSDPVSEERDIDTSKSDPRSTNGKFHTLGFTKKRIGRWHVYTRGAYTVRFANVHDADAYLDAVKWSMSYE